MTPADLNAYLKLLHVTTVLITGGLFLLRFTWMLQDKLAHQTAWIRTLPHYNDTLLLTSGLTMALLQDQLPLPAPWLASKLCLLLLYILLGSLALRWGRRRWIRATAGVAAIGCYLYIIGIALSRDPIPTFQGLISRFGIL